MPQLKKIKIQKTLETAQIAAFLRLLASEIEGGNEEGLKEYGVDLHNFNKLKVGLVKREGGQLHLKLKIRDSSAVAKKSKKAEDIKESEFVDIADLKYKPLKKQMSKTFKEIGQALRSEKLPADLTVERFMKESNQMVSFPGFGDEYYDQFLKVCCSMQEACKKKNISEVRQKYDAIQSLTKQCHRRYK